MPDSKISLDNKTSPTPLIACDVCYIRKIRCDRNKPCGNCIDSGVICLRERQKSEKKPRDSASREVSEAINEIKCRMTSLESSVATLIALATENRSQHISSNGSISRKRPRREEFCEPHKSRSNESASPHVTCQSASHSTPAFSAHEAQSLIQQELDDHGLSSPKQVAFHSALQSLKQTLNTSMVPHGSQIPAAPEPSLAQFQIPDPILMQWMLQSNDTGRSVCSESSFMPFTSRKTITRMSQNLISSSNPNFDHNLAALICVTSYAGYFLQEIVLSGHGDMTGLEDQLQRQALEYFTMARLATSRLLKSNPKPDLETVQALIFGVHLAQELGDFTSAWLIIEAANKVCIDLKLHKSNVISSYGDRADEAYYCFAVCYKTDKGLAMNLGKRAFMDDSIIEVNLLRPPSSKEDMLDNFRIYLELAQIQGRIISDLRPASLNRKSEILTDIGASMDQVWQLNIELQNKRKLKVSKYDSEIDSEMVNFAFYSVQTVMFHSGATGSHGSEYDHASLTAARSALGAMQKARELLDFSRCNSTYMKSSLAHWTILHYPFTAFFVVFCNVISTRHAPDYQLMQQFTAYLADAKDISISVSKLHKLCIPFCSLASNILASDEEIAFPHSYDQVQPLALSQNSAHTPQPTYHTSHPQSQLNMPTSQPYQMPPSQPSIDGYHNEDFLWDFTDTQPVLQWLDSDFSTLENVWEGMDWNMYS